MEEIRTQAEKHIEAKEDLTNRLKVERQPLVSQELKLGASGGMKGEMGYRVQTQTRDDNTQSFTPLKVKRTQILCEGEGKMSGVNFTRGAIIQQKNIGPFRPKWKG
ncbi:hypothetical protein CR513_49456, partial [Mucuna pruriens]